MTSDTDYAKLDSLDGLDALDEKGKPVESRIKDVKSALKIFNSLRKRMNSLLLTAHVLTRCSMELIRMISPALIPVGKG